MYYRITGVDEVMVVVRGRSARRGRLYIRSLGVQDACVGAASPRGRGGGAAGHNSCYPKRPEKHCICRAKMYYRITGGWARRWVGLLVMSHVIRNGRKSTAFVMRRFITGILVPIFNRMIIIMFSTSYNKI